MPEDIPHIVKNSYSAHCLLLAIMLAIMLAWGTSFAQGTQIKNGVNIQASYYNNGHVNMGWDLMQSYPEIEAVRIEIEPYRLHQAKTWISEAHEYGYQVIATYHDSQKLGSDSRDELMKAATWWKDNYTNLSSSGPIIINLMNEWGSHDINAMDYAQAYNQAMPEIREVYDGPLIIDVPGFGQATKIAADAYPFFNDQEITYSVHIYTSAFNIEQNRWLSHEDLEYLDATGDDCMVGELCDNSVGGSDWCSIIDHCYVQGWPLFGWAWNGDGKNMNMIKPFWKDEPLAKEFEPTEIMDVIIEKLAGVPCYTQPDEDCNVDLIGAPCDDENTFTINDRYNEHCHCVGNFVRSLQSNPSDADLIIYPNPVSEDQELSVDLFKIYEPGDLHIINTFGATIRVLPIERNQNRVFIDTHRLPQGIYHASYRSKRTNFISKIFVVH